MYCGFNEEQQKILNDISAMNKYPNSRERDIIEYNGSFIEFEGWAISNPLTGPIPKAVAVLGYKLKDGYRRITNDIEKKR